MIAPRAARKLRKRQNPVYIVLLCPRGRLTTMVMAIAPDVVAIVHNEPELDTTDNPLILQLTLQEFRDGFPTWRAIAPLWYWRYNSHKSGKSSTLQANGSPQKSAITLQSEHRDTWPRDGSTQLSRHMAYQSFRFTQKKEKKEKHDDTLRMCINYCALTKNNDQEPLSNVAHKRHFYKLQ